MSSKASAAANRRLEVHVHAALQLCGGGLGERDGRDLGERDAVVEDEVGDALHQLRGLAGAGAGLHEERAVEARAADELTIEEVGRIRRIAWRAVHSCSPTPS